VRIIPYAYPGNDFIYTNTNRKERALITVLYIIAKVTAILLSAVSLAMILRMLMPIFMNVEDNRLYMFCCLISEPFVIPVRYLMVKFNIGQNSPIDWAFCFSYLILSMLQTMLPVI
jgi:uncharacterized protein YggT (Ycf19 family)